MKYKGQEAKWEAFKQQLHTRCSELLYIMMACSSMFVCGIYMGFASNFYSPHAGHVHLTNNVSGYGVCTDFGFSDNGKWENEFHFHVQEGIRMQNLIPSAVFSGQILSALPAAYYANRLGRRKVLLTSNMPFYASFMVIYITGHLPKLFIFQFVAGIGMGMVNAVLPLYLSDIAHDSKRIYLYHSRLMMMGLGMLYSAAVTAFTSTEITFLLLFCIPVLFFVLYCFLPRSPCALVLLRKEYLAELSLFEMRAQEDFYDTREEFKQVRLKARNKLVLMERYSYTQELLNMFKNKASRNLLFISVGMDLFQQLTCFILSASNSAYFSYEIMPDHDSRFLALAIYSIIPVVSILSMIFLRKVSRRLLIIVSFIGVLIGVVVPDILIATDTLKGNEWAIYISGMIHFGFYALGVGPLTWEVASDIAPIDMKAEISGIETTIKAVFKVILVLLNGLRPRHFVLSCACISILGCVFVYFFVPETSKKTRQEIWKELKDAETRIWMYPKRSKEGPKILIVEEEEKEGYGIRETKSLQSYRMKSERSYTDETYKAKKEELIMKMIARRREPSGKFKEDVQSKKKKSKASYG